jgi:flagellar basal-body rod protein FlgG
MFRGLYTAASSLLTNTKKLDIVANNMANTNTFGYKKDVVTIETFEDALLAKYEGQYKISNTPTSADISVTSNEDIYEINTLKGFLKVDTVGGTSYSKSAKFTVDEEGYLTTFYKDSKGHLDTKTGNKVLGQNGFIKVDSNDFEIDEMGNVLSAGQVVDSLVHSAGPNIIGTTGYGVKLERINTNFEQGVLEVTQNELDFALEGDGFFTVLDSNDNEMYTRNGSFKLNENGELVTTEGFKVKGFEGVIKIEGSAVSVNDFGEILVDGTVVDKFDIINIENTYDLRKIGSSFYTMNENSEIVELETDAKVVQGFLETSNAVAIEEMIEMLDLYRTYEANQKMVRAYDETIQKSANEIGRL